MINYNENIIFKTTQTNQFIKLPLLSLYTTPIKTPLIPSSHTPYTLPLLRTGASHHRPPLVNYSTAALLATTILSGAKAAHTDTATVAATR